MFFLIKIFEELAEIVLEVLVVWIASPILKEPPSTLVQVGAICRLRHRELLDAAHIVPDRFSDGELTVKNGIALCKLHHAAFDSFLIGVTPDYVIRVRQDVLEEEDGPVLLHGLQELDSKKLILPTSQANWPSLDYLDWRYSRFPKAA